MSQPLLSILIPTVVGRESNYRKLFDVIYEQCKRLSSYNEKDSYGFMEAESQNSIVSVCWGGLVSVITGKDNKEKTIGEKREQLYQKSNGLFSWQIDDDDDISDNSIELILEAIKQEPDCITFRENCMMNGQYYSSNHSLKYDDWGEKQDGFDYVRTPFYKDVIKTEIARSVSFEHIRYGEDHAWARALKPHLKSEVHIDEELYFYIHTSKPEDHNTRYGIQ